MTQESESNMSHVRGGGLEEIYWCVSGFLVLKSDALDELPVCLGISRTRNILLGEDQGW